MVVCEEISVGTKHPGSEEVPLLKNITLKFEALIFGSKFTRNFGVGTTSAALLCGAWATYLAAAAAESEG